MKKRILYILNYPGKGGTEKYVLDLMKAVGQENCILVYSEDGPGLELFERSGIKTFQVAMNHPFDVKAAMKVKKIVKAQKIDVIHAQFLRENYISLLAKVLGARVDVIWTYHVDVPMNRLIRNVNRIMTKLNRKVIAVSGFMLNQLKAKGIQKEKLKLIYNGVDALPEFPMDSEGSIPVITMIGRLREEKGQEFLIHALSLLNTKSPELEWTCHIYGEGPDKDKLSQLVMEFNLEAKVHFKGFSNNKADMYAESDIITVPSSNEALSYVAIEAMSFAKAVVATNVGGIPEVVKDRETGLLVQYGDVEDLAMKLKELLTNQDLRGFLSENGKKHYLDQFTFDKMVSETINQYNL